mgnify:CR=1 FL=1
MTLSNEIFIFLKKIKLNNNRDWFQANKLNFKSQEVCVKEFGEELKSRLDLCDKIDSFKLFRIHRDIRFSKDKTPYKIYFGLTWKRIKPKYRGGYYFHISPGNNFLACGFWDPNSNDLNRIREELILNSNDFKYIVNSSPLNTIWGELKGNELKTAPRGVDKSHTDISLIRKKQYIFSIDYSDEEVCQKDFINKGEIALKAIRPFVDYMSEVLTTNKNGEPLF